MNKPREIAMLLKSISHTDNRFLSAKQICAAMGLSERELREVKGEALQAGYPIGSCTDKGYFWIKHEDLQKLREVKMHACTELHNASLAENNFYTFEKQTDLQFAE